MKDMILPLGKFYCYLVGKVVLAPLSGNWDASLVGRNGTLEVDEVATYCFLHERQDCEYYYYYYYYYYQHEHCHLKILEEDFLNHLTDNNHDADDGSLLMNFDDEK